MQYITYDNWWSLSKFTDIYEANLVKTGTHGKNRTDQNKILVAGGPGATDTQRIVITYCTGKLILDSKSRIPKRFLKKSNNSKKQFKNRIRANSRRSKRKSWKKTKYVEFVQGTCCWYVQGRNKKKQKFSPSAPRKSPISSYFQTIVARACDDPPKWW